MILQFICDLLFGLANIIVGLIPQFPSFADLNISTSPIFYVLRFVNLFVSVRTVGRCMLVVLVVYNIKFVWSILQWLIKKIPGVS